MLLATHDSWRLCHRTLRPFVGVKSQRETNTPVKDRPKEKQHNSKRNRVEKKLEVVSGESLAIFVRLGVARCAGNQVPTCREWSGVVICGQCGSFVAREPV